MVKKNNILRNISLTTSTTILIIIIANTYGLISDTLTGITVFATGIISILLTLAEISREK